MFYSMPSDEAQLVAADELSARGWWFHRRYKLWMLHAPNAALQKSARGERGAYLIFDVSVWEVVQKNDLEISYDDIEQAPRLQRPAKAGGGGGGGGGVGQQLQQLQQQGGVGPGGMPPGASAQQQQQAGQGRH